MSGFYEQVMKEYQPIVISKTPQKDSSWRTRVLKRKGQDGIVRLMVDIRKYFIDEKRAMFTESGMYVTLDQLDLLINNLQEARKDFGYGSKARN